ncbi:uncharacterized protein LOC144286077 isoform X2 [Canis aureus]
MWKILSAVGAWEYGAKETHTETKNYSSPGKARELASERCMTRLKSQKVCKGEVQSVTHEKVCYTPRYLRLLCYWTVEKRWEKWLRKAEYLAASHYKQHGLFPPGWSLLP